MMILFGNKLSYQNYFYDKSAWENNSLDFGFCGFLYGSTKVYDLWQQCYLNYDKYGKICTYHHNIVTLPCDGGGPTNTPVPPPPPTTTSPPPPTATPTNTPTPIPTPTPTPTPYPTVAISGNLREYLRGSCYNNISTNNESTAKRLVRVFLRIKVGRNH